MLRPPSWRPDAIPSRRGWVDPITGELLVGVVNLIDRLEQQGNIIAPHVAEPATSEVINDVSEPVEPHEPELVIEDQNDGAVDNQSTAVDSQSSVPEDPASGSETNTKKKSYKRKT